MKPYEDAASLKAAIKEAGIHSQSDLSVLLDVNRRFISQWGTAHSSGRPIPSWVRLALFLRAHPLSSKKVFRQALGYAGIASVKAFAQLSAESIAQVEKWEAKGKFPAWVPSFLFLCASSTGQGALVRLPHFVEFLAADDLDELVVKKRREIAKRTKQAK